MTKKIELELDLFFNLGPPERQCVYDFKRNVVSSSQGCPSLCVGDY